MSKKRVEIAYVLLTDVLQQKSQVFEFSTRLGSTPIGSPKLWAAEI